MTEPDMTVDESKEKTSGVTRITYDSFIRPPPSTNKSPFQCIYPGYSTCG